MDFFVIMRESLAREYLFEKEGSVDMLREGASDMVRSVVEWIKKFLTYIKELFKKLFMFIESVLMDTARFFEKYKDKLDLQNTFNVQMYQYDIALMKKVPDLTVLGALISEFNDFESKKDLTKLKVKEATREFLEPANLNKLRGKITLLNGNIEDDELSTALRKAFRKGKDDPEDTEVTQSLAREIITNYKENRDLLNTAKKDKAQLESSMARLKSYFEKGPSKMYVGNNETVRGSKVSMDGNKASIGEKEDLGMKFPVADAVYRYNYLQMKEISSITNRVLVEKVNALKEMVKAHAAIGKKAILSSGAKTVKDTEVKEKDGDSDAD